IRGLVEPGRAVGARAAVRVPVRPGDRRADAGVRDRRLADRPDRGLRVGVVRSVRGGRAAGQLVERRVSGVVGSRKRITVALVGLVLLVLVGWLVKTQLDSGSASAPSASGTRALSSLPPEATTTWRLIQKG